MNNILGQPVEGDDFFDRERETSTLWHSILEGNHILMLAPRRVGKTSLAIRVGAEATRDGWKFVAVDVQRDRDELGFLDNLFQNLKSAGVRVPILARLTQWVTIARRTVRGQVEVAGFSIQVDSTDDHEAATLEHLVERLFQEIEASDDRILLAVDELPVLLEALEEADTSGIRLKSFLNWFRAIRLRYRKSIRWLLLGSVGLDTFVEVRNLTATINDLQPSSLGAYSPDTALRFFKTLAECKRIEIDDELAQVAIDEIGWPLPFFLQLVFHQLYSRLGPNSKPNAEDITRACRELLAPEHYKHFEPWRGRLSEGMNAEHYRASMTILNSLCSRPTGLPRQALLSEVSALFPTREPADVARVLSVTLGQLERDGYLLRSTTDDEAASYSFRSFLLREYWFNRELA